MTKCRSLRPCHFVMFHGFCSFLPLFSCPKGYLQVEKYHISKFQLKHFWWEFENDLSSAPDVLLSISMKFGTDVFWKLSQGLLPLFFSTSPLGGETPTPISPIHKCWRNLVKFGFVCYQAPYHETFFFCFSKFRTEKFVSELRKENKNWRLKSRFE